MTTSPAGAALSTGSGRIAVIENEDTMKIRVLIVEDHPLMQRGLTSALQGGPQFEVVGCAETGNDGLDQAKELRPDVILLDLHLPELGGLSVLNYLRTDVPEARTIIVTASEEPQSLLDAVAAGAVGYLVKRSSPEEIRNAVLTVKNGGSVITPELAGHLLRQYAQASRGEEGAGTSLTYREREVLRRLAQGYTDREIAGELYVSTRTVQNALTSVRQKTGMRRRALLARWASERAL